MATEGKVNTLEMQEQVEGGTSGGCKRASSFLSTESRVFLGESVPDFYLWEKRGSGGRKKSIPILLQKKGIILKVPEGKEVR